MSIRIKFFSVIAMTFSMVTVADAVSTGWYVGGQVGATNTHNKTQTVYTNSATTPTLRVTPSNTGVGARFFTGYNFNQNVAFEMGLTHYGASTYKVPTSSGIVNNPTIHEYGFDMEGKGIYPFANGMGVFGKAGFSVMRASQSGSLVPPSGTASNTSATNTSVRPLIGLGLSYDLSQNWVTDLSWTRVLGGGNIQSADFIGLGISYHWVDLYCGQFLC